MLLAFSCEARTWELSLNYHEAVRCSSFFDRCRRQCKSLSQSIPPVYPKPTICAPCIHFLPSRLHTRHDPITTVIRRSHLFLRNAWNSSTYRWCLVPISSSTRGRQIQCSLGPFFCQNSTFHCRKFLRLTSHVLPLVPPRQSLIRNSDAAPS